MKNPIQQQKMKKIILAALFLFLVAGVYGVGYSEDGSGFATFGGTRMCMSDGSVPLTGTWDFSNTSVVGIDFQNTSGYVYVGNNETDISSLVSEEGKIVHVAEGNYYFNSSVVLANNTKLICDSNQNSKLILADGSNTHFISINYKSNVLIENCFIDPNEPNQAGDYHGVRIANAHNITLKDNTILGARHHTVNALLDSEWNTNLKYLGNTVYVTNSSSYDAGGLLMRGHNGLIRDNVVYDYDFTGIEVYHDSENITVDSNTVHWYPNTNNLGAIAVMSEAHNTKVTNNRILGYGGVSGTSALKLSGDKKSIVTGNTIENVPASIGVWMSSSDDTIFSNNMIYDSNYGIYCEGEEVIIDSNIIKDSLSTHIYLRNACDKAIVSNNYLSDSGSSGLQVQGSSNNSMIINNFVYNAGNFGIYTEADNGMLMGNFIYNTSSFAIRIKNSDYFMAVNNFVANNVGGGISYFLNGSNNVANNNLE